MIKIKNKKNTILIAIIILYVFIFLLLISGNADINSYPVLFFSFILVLGGTSGTIHKANVFRSTYFGTANLRKSEDYDGIGNIGAIIIGIIVLLIGFD